MAASTALKGLLVPHVLPENCYDELFLSLNLLHSEYRALFDALFVLSGTRHVVAVATPGLAEVSCGGRLGAILAKGEILSRWPFW